MLRRKRLECRDVWEVRSATRAAPVSGAPGPKLEATFGMIPMLVFLESASLRSARRARAGTQPAVP